MRQGCRSAENDIYVRAWEQLLEGDTWGSGGGGVFLEGGGVENRSTSIDDSLASLGVIRSH